MPNKKYINFPIIIMDTKMKMSMPKLNISNNIINSIK